MNIIKLEKQHLEEAKIIALSNYDEERQFTKALPSDFDFPDLEYFAGNELGVAAVEDKKLIGFMACCEPFDEAFGSTDVKGVFSPMGLHAAISENRADIYAAMYQAAGEKWVKAGAVSHGICLYAHDEELHRQFYRYGFGLRCMDAIRSMDLIDCPSCPGYDFTELAKDEYHLAYPLELALNRHYLKSPFFMNREPETLDEFLESSAQEEARLFAAKHNGVLCAILRITASGETFAAAGETYRHINGAYCLPEHRGRGVYQKLFNVAVAALKAEGCTRLGVDFESINPNAYGFWLKYFTAYTHGVVRRIDERITRPDGFFMEKMHSKNKKNDNKKQ